MPKLGKVGRLAKRITLLEQEGEGRVKVTLLHKKRQRKKGQATAKTRSDEKRALKAANALQEFSRVYKKKHRKANRNKKDGWIRDLEWNVKEARRRALKKYPAAIPLL